MRTRYSLILVVPFRLCPARAGASIIPTRTQPRNRQHRQDFFVVSGGGGRHDPKAREVDRCRHNRGASGVSALLARPSKNPAHYASGHDRTTGPEVDRPAAISFAVDVIVGVQGTHLDGVDTVTGL